MPTGRSDYRFALALAMAAWAAVVPVLQLAAARDHRRPTIVVERICPMPSHSGSCAAERACVAGRSCAVARRSCAAEQTARACAATPGGAERATGATRTARCCMCIFVGDLTMAAAPALAAVSDLPLRERVAPGEASAASRIPAPSSPPPERC